MHQPSRSENRGGSVLLLIWLTVVLFLSVAHARAQAPSEPASAGAAGADAGPGTGQLELICSAGRIALPAVHTDIELDVTGPLIRAIVRQDFANPTGEVVSARYLFPLPESAAVAAMELQIGQRRIVSVVKEKEAARQVYEQARREGRKAALLSSARPNLFVTEVANLAPGEQVSVRLEYLDQAGYEDGWFSLAVPLTFTPRFFPLPACEAPPVVAAASETGVCVEAAAAGSAPAAAAAPRLTRDDLLVLTAPFARPDDPAFPQAAIAVELAPGLELADVLSPSHTVRWTATGEAHHIEPDPRIVPADRDFLLRWRPTSDPLARPLLFCEEGPDALYALLMVVPGDPDPTAPRPPTDTVFVLDVSGSMGGPSIAQARDALIAALGALREGDRFTMLAFDDQTYPWRLDLQPLDPGTRQAARDWVLHRQARGGTLLHPALLRARLMCGDGPEPGRARQIILLTDAAVGNEAQLLGETTAAMKDVRLHVVGIGPAPNRYLVRRLAGQGGGQPLFVSGHADDASRLGAFLQRIGRPQWSDPRLAWAGLPQVAGYPARLPAPVPGELVLWSGRFPAGTDLRGALLADGGAGGLELPLQAVAAPAGSGLATRWARLRVDDLLAEFDSGVRSDELRGQIVATALEHGLVTRFTSRVAVELVPSVDVPGATRDLPSGLPKGSQLMGALPVGGTLDDLWRLLGVALLLTGTITWSIRLRRFPR